MRGMSVLRDSEEHTDKAMRDSFQAGASGDASLADQ